MGIFYPPNLTPDRETGLGAWSEGDIVTAVRTGARPDGRILAPVMPYHNYARLTDADSTGACRVPEEPQAGAQQGAGNPRPGRERHRPFLTVMMPK